MQASAAGDVIGDRTVYAGFAETVVPVFGPQNALPGLKRLEFGASMRYEHYSDFGSTSNPKFTLDWRPIEPLMIRASYNEGFRAPNLSVMNYPTRFTVGANFDPYRGPVTGLPIDGQSQRQTAIQSVIRTSSRKRPKARRSASCSMCRRSTVCASRSTTGRSIRKA